MINTNLVEKFDLIDGVLPRRTASRLPTSLHADVVSVCTEWCMQDDGIRPSCEGHDVIRVSRTLTADEREELFVTNEQLNNWGSIEVIEP